MLPASSGFKDHASRRGTRRQVNIQDPPFNPGAHPCRREVDLTHGFFELLGGELGTRIEGDCDQLPVQVFLGCGNAFQAL